MIEALFSLMKCASWMLHLSDGVTWSTKESIMWLDWDHSHLKSLWYNFTFLISSIYFCVHCPFYCKYLFSSCPSTGSFEAQHRLTAKGFGVHWSFLVFLIPHKEVNGGRGGSWSFRMGSSCAEFFLSSIGHSLHFSLKSSLNTLFGLWKYC